MSTAHINAANNGDIAESILLPGDPLRAKFIAENFLENPRCYNEIRGMLGYTGSYKGVPVSVQGSGMGMPSMGIYSYELIKEYGVQNLIRVGSAGSFHEDIKLMDIVVGLSAPLTPAGSILTVFPAFSLPAAILTFYLRSSRLPIMRISRYTREI